MLSAVAEQSGATLGALAALLVAFGSLYAALKKSKVDEKDISARAADTALKVFEGSTARLEADLARAQKRIVALEAEVAALRLRLMAAEVARDLAAVNPGPAGPAGATGADGAAGAEGAPGRQGEPGRDA